MTSSAYIEIPGWDTFQHYKDRYVPWIKTYTELLHKDEYLTLTSHQRGVLHGIWLAYASSHRRLTADTRRLSRHLNVRVMTRDLAALSDAGFIELVTRPHKQQPGDNPETTRAPVPSQEGEVEREEENPNPEGSPVSSNPSVRTAEANYDARNETDGIDYVDKREQRDPDDYGPPGIDYANILRGIGE